MEPEAWRETGSEVCLPRHLQSSGNTETPDMGIDTNATIKQGPILRRNCVIRVQSNNVTPAGIPHRNFKTSPNSLFFCVYVMA